jgi:hypothetical protein
MCYRRVPKHLMRRLPSSINQDKILDSEIDEVFCGSIVPSVEIPLEPRNRGERVMYVGISSRRVPLIEIGIEECDGELVVFHAREATGESVKTYKKERGTWQPRR